MDGDGVRDAGEPGIGGVTITLTGLDERGNPVSRTTTTNPDGTWAITDLLPSGPDGYTLAQTQPAGWLDGSDASSVNGTITNDTVSGVHIGAGETVESGHYGEIAPVRVGDFVWNDVNANGRQDAGEPGIAGVKVTLTGTNDLGELVNVSVTTGADGEYLFEGLRPGAYTITFADPTGMAATYSGVGDAAGNSDATGACRCVVVTLFGNPDLATTTSDRLDLDAGYYTPVSLEGRVWDDLDGDGKYDPDVDKSRGGWEIQVQGAGPDGVIGTSDDPPPIKVVVNPDGTYVVDDLPPGPYVVTSAGREPIRVVIPPGGVGRADFPYPKKKTLPITGTQTLIALPVGFALLLIGGVLVRTRRRRRAPVV